MSKHAILTLTALITLGTSVVVTPPTLAAAKSVHRTAKTTKTKHPKKVPKNIELGKRNIP